MRQQLTGRGAGLWGLFGLQLFCAVFLLSEVTGDLVGWENESAEDITHIIEFAVIVTLLIGVVSTGSRIRHMLTHHEHMHRQLKAASGAFIGLVEDYFDEWALTPSERDVALLSLKGLLISGIALCEKPVREPSRHSLTPSIARPG